MKTPKKLLLLFVKIFFISLTVQVFAQKSKQVDSLLNLISTSKSDSVKMRLHRELCRACPVNENLKHGGAALQFTNQLISKGTKEISLKKLLEQKIFFFEIISFYHEEHKNYTEEIEVAKKMIEVAVGLKDTLKIEEKYALLARKLQKAGDSKSAFDTLFSRLKLHEHQSVVLSAFYHRNIGEFYYENGNNEKALSHYSQSYILYTKLKKYRTASEVLLRIAEEYQLIGQSEKSISKSKENLELTKKTNDLNTKISILSQMAFTYLSLGKLNESENTIQQLFAAAKEHKNTNAIGTAYFAMASLYEIKKDFKKQEEYLLKCIEYYETTQDKSGIIYRLISLSVFYLNQGNYNKAILSAERGLNLSKETKDIYSQRDFLSLLYLSFKKINKATEALDKFEKLQIMKDSIKIFENRSAIENREKSLEYERKQQELKTEQERKDLIAKDEKEKQQVIRNALFAGCVLISLVLLLIIRGYRQKKTSNQLLTERNLSIAKQKEEVESQKVIIEEKQKEILDSINYAKRIQYTLLAHENFLKENLPEHFTFFNPKDIVSGDFYWAASTGLTENKKFYLAVCDSTGHGVPGAFMSLLNIGFLSEAINEKGINKPSDVFNFVRTKLENSISKEGQKDGFDGILLCMDRSNNSITYAAANNAPILIQNNQLIELPADRMPVGVGERKENFTLHTIDAKPGDILYLYTDGYADQFGGPKGKKFKYKQLNELLFTLNSKPFPDQQKELKYVFEKWKGDLEQVDDVCVIGIKI